MRTFPTIFLIAALLPIHWLPAQNQNPAPSPTPVGATAGDAILALWLHTACTNEIALAGLAVKQSKDVEVRAFAQKMVDEHTAFAARLQPFTVALAPAGKVEPSGKPAPRDASAPRLRASADTFDHAALIRDLGARCLASESQILTSKPAADFDRCFMTMQIAAHVKGIDMLTVFRAHASPSLVATIDEGLKTYGAHHTHAVDVQKKLGDGTAEARTGR